MSRARELARLGNANAIAVDSDYNVGLGTTTSIQYKLDVVGDANFVGVITATSFGGDGSALTGIANTGFIDSADLTVSGISTFAGVTKVTNTTASTSSATGALIVSGGVGIAGSLHVGENVSVGGTLTYEDVTNIDSVGVVTARLGVNVSGGEIAVGAAFSVGQAGVVTATSFVGSGANLTGIPALTGSTDNTLVTVTGANAISGESNLKFDGSRLDVDSSAQNILQLNSTNSDGPAVPFQRSGSSIGNVGSAAAITGGTAEVFAVGAATTLVFSSGGANERLRIDASGRVGINTDSFNDDYEYLLVHKTGAACNLSIVGGTSSHSSLNMGDTDDFNIQKIRSGHTDNSLALFTNNVSRLHLDNAGRIGINTDSFSDAREALRVQAPAGQSETFLSIISPSTTGSSQIFFGDDDFNEGRIDYNHDENSMAFFTNDSERARFTKTGGLSLDNGELIERYASYTSSANFNGGNVDLDNGMVHYCNQNLSGANTVNITNSVGINTQMASGDMMAVTLITAVNVNTAYINHITIDHSTAPSEYWIGGSAPGSGDGGTSNVDIYTFNILKNGNNSYIVIGNHIKTS